MLNQQADDVDLTITSGRYERGQVADVLLLVLSSELPIPNDTATQP